MRVVREGDLLWNPSPERSNKTNLTAFMRWLRRSKGLDFGGYSDLWTWSVKELEQFWSCLADYFKVWPEPYKGKVLSTREMPGASWFEEAELNYASMLGEPREDRIAIVALGEGTGTQEISYSELHRFAARFQSLLEELGLRRGERVAGYLPNIPETVFAFLATAASGAVWSCCSPEFGTRAVLDRFAQIEPSILIATPSYRYGGKIFDRSAELNAILASLPSVRGVILVDAPSVAGDSSVPESIVKPKDAKVRTVAWRDFAGDRAGSARLEIDDVPFDHPLWILYSSGTTGLPKPIVHSHGGIVLEHLKALHLHMDLGPRDRFFWYTSTGWMMWNFLVSGLLLGSTIVLYDGSAFWPTPDVLWRLAEEVSINCFGVSGPYIHACMKQGLAPGRDFDLDALETVGSTGAPLSPEGFAWLYDAVADDLLVASISGGTDVCTAFVGSVPTLPVHAGEIQARCLGAAVEAFDENGNPLVDKVGELVITAPLPSMPLYFWNDPEMKRYKEAYFSVYPGVWRHGDWIKITERGSCVIYGRSDATLNRGGLRMGTAEFYRVVESIPEIEDSLIIDLADSRGPGKLLLFVVPGEGNSLDPQLKDKIEATIRSQLSPRHVPDEIFEVSAVPKTINAKKMEVPVKRIFQGVDPSQAVSKGSMANPESLEEYISIARSRIEEER